MMHHESQHFRDSEAALTAPFALNMGGKYEVAVVGAGFGTVDFQKQLPDGSYVSVGTDTTFSANGVAQVDLPPGIYQFVVTTATAVYASVTRIPLV